MTLEVKVPAMGESIIEATVGKWLKQVGEPVSVDEPLVELETDKVNVEVVSSQAGVLEKIIKQEGATVTVSDVLATVAEGDASGAAQAATPPAEAIAGNGAASQEAAPAAASAEAERVTPVARRIAAEHGIDLSQVPASGAGGKVTKEDVMSYMERRQPQATVPTEAPAPAPAPAVATDRREERIPLSRRQQTMAVRMAQAVQTTAMTTTFNEADMSGIMEIRKRRRDSFKERHGVSLGFMSFFTKAVVEALKEFPIVNSELQGNELVRKHYYDIGIAISTDDSLVVPVVRDADKMNFAQVESAILDLATRARDRKLTIEELQGGTFTITNGGIFGSLMSTPLLNPPQVGILGMHGIKERPVVVDGQIAVRPMMYIALTYDHRIVDGKSAVSCLVRIKELVEDPARLLVGD